MAPVARSAPGPGGLGDLQLTLPASSVCTTSTVNVAPDSSVAVHSNVAPDSTLMSSGQSTPVIVLSVCASI